MPRKRARELDTGDPRPRTVTIQLPRFHPGQLEVLNSPARYRVVVCGRRWGKTALGVFICLMAALRGKRVWWVAPFFATALIGWRMLKRFVRQLPDELVPDISESEHTITFPWTGGSVTIKSAHDPDSLRGEGLDGLVMDEAPLCKQAAWTEVLRPMLLLSGGWAVFMGTPRGRNWFADLFDRAGTRSNWARWQLPTSNNPMVPEAELLEALEDMGAVVFAQEHGAQFLDAIGTVFRQDSFRYFHVDLDAYEPHYHLLDGGRRRSFRYSDLDVYATCDPALSLKQTADYTAIGVFGMTSQTDMLVLDMQRFRAEHSDVVAALRRTEQRWPHLSYIGVDRNSIGLGIIQDAINAGVNVQELPNKGDKVQRAHPVANRMIHGKVWLDSAMPTLREFETELLAFPTGAHDDMVDALAYADAHRREATTGGVRLLETEERLGGDRGWRSVDDGAPAGGMRWL